MLPGVSDELLRDELVVVVNTGWDLPTRPHRAPEVRHLLELARQGDHEQYSETAARLLKMLLEAIDIESGEEFTDDEADGLKILFGLQEHCRIDGPGKRHREAIAFLRDPTLRQIEVRSWIKRQRGHWMQRVVECLRRVYGQDTLRTAGYLSVQRTSSAVVGTDQLIETVKLDNLIRVFRDGVRELEYNFYTQPETGVTDVHIEPLYGEEVLLFTKPAGRYYAVIRLPKPAKAGDTIPWGFERTYIYADHRVAPTNDHLTIVVRRPLTYVKVEVTFAGPIPSSIWALNGTNPRQLPSEPSPEVYLMDPAKREQVFADEHGIAHYPLTYRTEGNAAYGLAWSWNT